MPSTVLPLATLAAKATVPSALSAGTGWRPSPEIVPPPGAGSPSTVTLVMPLRRREEEPLSARPAQERREERHLPARIERGDDRQRLDAEVLERPAAGRRLAGGDHGAHGEGLRGERARREEAGEQCRDGEERDHAAAV